jgi:hypothetical protein
MKNKKFLIFGILIFLMFGIFFVSAATCCERLAEPGEGGNAEWCQITESSDKCHEDYTYKDNVETCMTLVNCNVGCMNRNTGECNNIAVGRCIEEGGIPDPEKREVEDIPYCQLGCCVMGEYSYMMTNVECNTFAEENGGRSIFREDITERDECAALIESTEFGACTISNEFGETSCKIIAKNECTKEKVISNEIVPAGWGEALLESMSTNFYEGYLCTAIINGNAISDCQPSKQTECKDGKVYWKDTCGNFANIYDYHEYDNDDYWSKIYEYYDEEVCTVEGDGSNTCGNCEIAGSTVCQGYKKADLKEPDNNDGGLVCGSLYCIFEDAAGNKVRYENGETWCDGGITGALANVETGGGAISIYMNEYNEILLQSRKLLEREDLFNTPGSRYFRLRCSNGEIKIDDCQDYRDSICVEYVTSDGKGNYQKTNHASCIPNTGETECTWILDKENCENSGRLCKWIPGYRIDFSEVSESERREAQGTCVPLIAPGFPFWTGLGAGVCAQGIVQENTLFETNILRDRDDFNFDTWKIGSGENAPYLGERCYDNCYTIPGYADRFNTGMLDEKGNKIYPEDIMERFPEVDWSKPVKGIQGLSPYEMLSMFYDRSRFELPVFVKNYNLSTRRGQYCHELDEPEAFETGKLDGVRYDCAGIQLDYDRSQRKERDYPIYLTHEEWLNSITERARSFGDCGYKKNPEGGYSDSLSEIITVVFQKLDQSGDVKRNITAQKIIYKGDSSLSEDHKLKFFSYGIEIPQEIEVGEAPCGEYPDGTVCIVPPGYCETESLGECRIGATTGVCCNTNYPEGTPGGEE